MLSVVLLVRPLDVGQPGNVAEPEDVRGERVGRQIVRMERRDFRRLRQEDPAVGAGEVQVGRVDRRRPRSGLREQALSGPVRGSCDRQRSTYVLQELTSAQASVSHSLLSGDLGQRTSIGLDIVGWLGEPVSGALEVEAPLAGAVVDDVLVVDDAEAG